CTDGSDEAHATAWIVVLVVFPASSLSTTLMSNGALPLHGMSIRVLVPVAATATHRGELPMYAHRFCAAAPNPEPRLAASAEGGLANTGKLPFVRSPGPKNCPSVGDDTVRLGGVVSTTYVPLFEWPTTPLCAGQAAWIS